MKECIDQILETQKSIPFGYLDVNVDIVCSKIYCLL